MMLPGPDGCENPGEGGQGAYPIFNAINDHNPMGVPGQGDTHAAQLWIRALREGKAPAQGYASTLLDLREILGRSPREPRETPARLPRDPLPAGANSGEQCVDLFPIFFYSESENVTTPAAWELQHRRRRRICMRRCRLRVPWVRGWARTSSTPWNSLENPRMIL